jgi:hypothetical protein
VVPAHQRLAARDLIGLEADDGLVVQDKLMFLERELEIGFNLLALPDLLVLSGLEEGKAVSAMRLGFVERDVDVLQ